MFFVFFLGGGHTFIAFKRGHGPVFHLETSLANSSFAGKEKRCSLVTTTASSSCDFFTPTHYCPVSILNMCFTTFVKTSSFTLPTGLNGYHSPSAVNHATKTRVSICLPNIHRTLTVCLLFPRVLIDERCAQSICRSITLHCPNKPQCTAAGPVPSPVETAEGSAAQLLINGC